MERKFAKVLGFVLLALAGMLMAPGAGAGTATGQLSVGITILDACRLDPNATGPLAAVAGFGLKCSHGTDYAVRVNRDVQRQSGQNSAGQTTVTVRF